MKPYFPIINLLRGVAALLVCFYHFVSYSDFRGELFPKDDILVQLSEYGIQGIFIFFVVSGVVIPISMFTSNYRINGVHRFLWRRWLRIELPYFGSIALVLLVSLAFAYKNNTEFMFEPMRLLHHVTYTIPFTDYDWYNIIYWTLAIEFQFYIVMGLLYPLIASEKKYNGILTLVLFGSTALLTDDNRLVFYYAPIFALGILVFLLKVKRINEFEWGALSLLMVPIIWYVHSFEIMLFSLMTAMVIVYIKAKKRQFRIGNISYSLYLTHGLIGGNVIYLLSRNLTSYWTKAGLVLLAIVVSIIFAWIYWKFLEDPARKLSKRVKLR